MKDIQPIEENEDLNENHQNEEESEDEVEVDIHLDKLKEFSSQYAIPSISSDTEMLCLATIGLYSKKYMPCK